MNDTTTPLQASGIGVTLGGVRVLDEVSLALPAGCWTAIVGPNGAGKSTLLSVLAGLRRPDDGQVSVGGDPIETLAARERARRIAWLAQQGEADGELAVREIVALGRLPHHGLFGAPGADDQRAVDLLVVDEAMQRLAAVDPELAQIVELRFFAGLQMQEIAAVLGTSLSGVERAWRLASAFLRAELADR